MLSLFTNSKPKGLIWTGELIWFDKSPDDRSHVRRAIDAHAIANCKDGKVEITADNWPSQLRMKLIATQMAAQIAGPFYEDATIVVLMLTPSETLDALIAAMTLKIAGWVHFPVEENAPECNVKVFVMLYCRKYKKFYAIIPKHPNNILRHFKQHERQVVGQWYLRRNAPLRKTIWRGVMEWSLQGSKHTKLLDCNACPNFIMGQPEINIDDWPVRLQLRLTPKRVTNDIFGRLDGRCKTVTFRARPGEGIDLLIAKLSSGLAGWMLFPFKINAPVLDIKILIILPTTESNAFLGYIPQRQLKFWGL